MIDIHSPLAKPAAFCAGAALHLLIFSENEWDIAAVRLLVPLALFRIGAGAALPYLLPGDDGPAISAAKTAFGLGLSLSAGLALGMFIYRSFFHRLRGFPGPFLARFSNLHVTTMSAKNLHLYEEVQSLHRKYGDFVRIGGLPSREITRTIC